MLKQKRVFTSQSGDKADKANEGREMTERATESF